MSPGGFCGMFSTQFLTQAFLCLLRSAEHASYLPFHGPRAGHEHVPASLAVPVGVLHGDWLRLVGHPAPRPAQYGPEPGGEAARRVHAAERGPAAGQRGWELPVTQRVGTGRGLGAWEAGAVTAGAQRAVTAWPCCLCLSSSWVVKDLFVQHSLSLP